MRKRSVGTGLENAAQKAGATAQQAAEDAADEPTRERKAAADRRLAEAAVTADVGVGQHVADRAHHFRRPEETAALFGETTDHVTQPVVARHDAALVAEETALAVEEATEESSEEAAVSGADQLVNRRNGRTDVR